MLNQAYQKGQHPDLILNIFIWNLFFDDIDVYLTNYTGDTIPHAMILKIKKLSYLKKNIDKLFDRISDNCLKANPEKSHLLMNIDER